MPQLHLAHLLAPERLQQLDGSHIESFNRRAKEPYRLHPELGASAFEGDLDAAGVVLLLANPGYDGTSTIEDHRFSRPGWPLAGLHPDAPPGLRAWWTSRLRVLIEDIGAQAVSQRVACLQFCPWASNRFGTPPRLPSQQAVLEAASRCADRGAVLLIMRAEKLWLQADAVRLSARRHRVKSWRCSYVSPGNLTAAGWADVVSAVGAHSSGAKPPQELGADPRHLASAG